VDRHIIAPDAIIECVGCVDRVETSSHLFLHCPSAMAIWYDLFRWLGIVVVMPPSIPMFFEVFCGSVYNKKIRHGFMLIWHASLCLIWKARNNTIFVNGTFNPKGIVDEIKVLSWKWSLARLKLPPCLYYEWTWDPGDCLLR
jgi:hypothetical protein